MARAKSAAMIFSLAWLSGCMSDITKDGFFSISSPPTVLIQEPSDGSSFRTAEPILFKALAQSTVHTPNELLHTWTAGPVTICETQKVGADGYATCAWAFDDFGEHTVTVSVVDPNSDFGSHTVTINIVENFPPTIEVIQPVADGIYDTSELIPIELLLDDPEDFADELSVTASSSVDGTLSTPTEVPSDGVYSTGISLSPGEHLLNFTVTDTLGAYASSSFLIAVTQSPSAPVVSITPDPARTGEQVNVQIDTPSSDPDGDTVTYSYTWSIAGVQLNYPTTKDFIDAGTTERGEDIELWVTPNDGYLDGPPGYALMTVSNGIPQITDCDISPVNPLSHEDLVASPSGWSDVDGDSAEYTYNWLIKESGNWVETGVSTSTFPGTSTQLGDKLKVECVPFDGIDSGDAVTSPSVEIGNSPPTISSCDITPKSPDTNNKLTANPVDIDDIDGDPVSVWYEWSVNGVVESSATGSTLPKGKTEKGDLVEVNCTTNDGSVDGGSATGSVVIGNTAPDAPVVSFSPPDAQTNSRLDVVIDTPATDDDNDSLTYTYEFTVDGVNAQGPSSKSFIGKNTVQRGEYWEVAVSASDGTDDSPVATADITIANSLPTLTDCDISPSNPGVSDDLIADGGGFDDADGDPEDYSYIWHIDYHDGSGWTEARSTKKLPSSYTAIDYDIKVTCTADDGYGLGESVDSLVISVSNSPPTATGCVLASLGSDPNIPETGDDLQAAGSGFSDPDGDPEQYRFRWYRNGVQDTSITDDTATIYAASNTKKGQQIHVECIPYDDLAGDGAAVASNSLTVGNTAPEAPVVSMSPSQPNTQDTLTVNIDYQEPDPDGDPLTYTYSWNLTANTARAISPTLTTEGDIWTVNVIACDADPITPKCSATAGVSSVTIENSLPTLTDCYIDPSVPMGEDDLQAVPVGWADPDGDAQSVSYEWAMFDGANWNVIGSSSSTLASALTTRDSEYKVVCTPMNGADAGPAMESFAVTIANTPPSLSSCSIAPTDPVTGDDLTAIPGGWTDPDGDPASHSFEWYVNGLLAHTSTSPDLAATNFG